MTDEVNTKPEGNESETGEQTPATQTPPAATTKPPASQPAKGQDWEGAYKGMQRNYDKLMKENAELQTQIAELNTTIESFKQEVKTATTEKDQIAVKHVEATEALKGLESQNAVLKAKSERQQLIMNEYQDLAKFEAQGLLPEAQNDEELRAKFDAFRETLGETVQTSTDEKLKGIGPGPVEEKAPEPLNRDQLYDRMTALGGTQDPEERRELAALQEQWYALDADE